MQAPLLDAIPKGYMKALLRDDEEDARRRFVAQQRSRSQQLQQQQQQEDLSVSLQLAFEEEHKEARAPSYVFSFSADAASPDVFACGGDPMMDGDEGLGVPPPPPPREASRTGEQGRTLQKQREAQQQKRPMSPKSSPQPPSPSPPQPIKSEAQEFKPQSLEFEHQSPVASSSSSPAPSSHRRRRSEVCALLESDIPAWQQEAEAAAASAALTAATAEDSSAKKRQRERDRAIAAFDTWAKRQHALEEAESTARAFHHAAVALPDAALASAAGSESDGFDAVPTSDPYAELFRGSFEVERIENWKIEWNTIDQPGWMLYYELKFKTNPTPVWDFAENPCGYPARVSEYDARLNEQGRSPVLRITELFALWTDEERRNQAAGELKRMAEASTEDREHILQRARRRGKRKQRRGDAAAAAAAAATTHDHRKPRGSRPVKVEPGSVPFTPFFAHAGSSSSAIAAPAASSSTSTESESDSETAVSASSSRAQGAKRALNAGRQCANSPDAVATPARKRQRPAPKHVHCKQETGIVAAFPNLAYVPFPVHSTRLSADESGLQFISVQRYSAAFPRDGAMNDRPLNNDMVALLCTMMPQLRHTLASAKQTAGGQRRERMQRTHTPVSASMHVKVEPGAASSQEDPLHADAEDGAAAVAAADDRPSRGQKRRATRSDDGREALAATAASWHGASMDAPSFAVHGHPFSDSDAHATLHTLRSLVDCGFPVPQAVIEWLLNRLIEGHEQTSVKAAGLIYDFVSSVLPSNPQWLLLSPVHAQRLADVVVWVHSTLGEVLAHTAPSVLTMDSNAAGAAGSVALLQHQIADARLHAAHFRTYESTLRKYALFVRLLLSVFVADAQIAAEQRQRLEDEGDEEEEAQSVTPAAASGLPAASRLAARPPPSPGARLLRSLDSFGGVESAQDSCAFRECFRLTSARRPLREFRQDVMRMEQRIKEHLRQGTPHGDDKHGGLPHALLAQWYALAADLRTFINHIDELGL